MEDIGLFKQGWTWIQSKRHGYSSVRNLISCLRDKAAIFFDHHWPIVCSNLRKLGSFILVLFLRWKECVIRGFRSFIGLGSASLLVIMWSCFLSLTSMSCLVYVLVSMVSNMFLLSCLSSQLYVLRVVRLSIYIPLLNSLFFLSYSTSSWYHDSMTHISMVDNLWRN